MYLECMFLLVDNDSVYFGKTIDEINSLGISSLCNSEDNNININII